MIKSLVPPVLPAVEFDDHQDGDIIVLTDLSRGIQLSGSVLGSTTTLQHQPAGISSAQEFQIHHSTQAGWVYLQSARPSKATSSAIRPFLFYDGVNPQPKWLQRDPTTGAPISDLGGFLFQFAPAPQQAGVTSYTLTSRINKYVLKGPLEMHPETDKTRAAVPLQVTVLSHTANPSAQNRNPIPIITAASTTTTTNKVKTLSTNSGTNTSLPFYAWLLFIIALLLFFAVIIVFLLAYQRGYRYVLPKKNI